MSSALAQTGFNNIMDKTVLARNKLVLLSGLLLVSVLTTIGVGAVSIPVSEIPAILVQMFFSSKESSYPAHYEVVIYSIRIPRIILACFVGAALSLSGAALQGLFRNPLADPGLIGVSSGAAFGAALMIVCGHTVFQLLPAFAYPYLLSLAAFAGGFLTTLIIYRIGHVNGRTYVATMLLAGIAINAIAMSLTGVLIYISDDQQLRDLTFWMMGSLGRNTWSTILPAIPLFLISMFVLMSLAKQLNLFVLGESSATHLGLNTERVKRTVLLASSLAVGTAVSLTGIIGFVGLVVPHLTRMLLGPDHRYLIPGAMLMGAGLLVIADAIARIIVTPAELPIGIITSCLGGPFFLYLLVRKRGIEA